MLLKFYFRLLLHHPLLVSLVVFAVSLTCLASTIAIKGTLKLSDPQVGFETHGTEISRRTAAWKRLYEASSVKGNLTSNPKYILDLLHEHDSKNSQQRVATSKWIPSNKKMYQNMEWTKWQEIDELLESSTTIKNDRLLIMPEEFLCGSPHEDYVKLVISNKNGVDLFQRDALMEICYLETQLAKVNFYKELCSERHQKPYTCCRSWSLPNYIAQLQDKHSCESITDEDIHRTKALLARCAEYYHYKQLNLVCTSKSKCNVPEECFKNDVYNMFNYIITTSFVPVSLESNNLLNVNLQETAMFLPLPGSESVLQYYHELERTSLETDLIQIVALDFGIKNALFNERMIWDTLWLIVGVLLIFVLMWVHTESILLTFTTIFIIIVSLGTALLLYIYVFGLDFFPFLNLIVVVVILGIGADDMFIFYKFWQSDEPKSFTEMVEKLNEAFISISVTACTTAVTFVTTILCPITAMQCFGIFSTTAVITNWFFVMICIPISLVLQEKWKSNPLQIQIYVSQRLQPIEKFIKKLKAMKTLKYWKKNFDQEQFVVNLVIKYRVIWIGIFTTLIVGSFVVIFVYPAVQFPSTQEFQLFHSNHPFEKYDMKYRNKFWFEKSNQVHSMLLLCGFMPTHLKGFFASKDRL